MKKQGKATVTYRKNGKEITKIFTKCNRNRILKEIIFLFDSSMELSGEYDFDEEIKYLHFKNVTFPCKSTIDFTLNDDQILILEDCTFQGYRMDIDYGHVELICPKFLDQNRDFTIHTNNLEYLNIILNQISKQKDFLSLSINAKNIELDANLGKELHEIFLNVTENANFKNIVCELEYFDVIARKEINFEHQNDITVKNDVGPRLLTRKLNLGNAKIQTQNPYLGTSIDIYCSSIVGEKYQLIANNTIRINETVYQNKDKQTSLILTSREFQEESKIENRRQLISILKGLRDNQQIIYQNYINEISKNIMEQLQNQSIGKYIKNPPKVLKRKHDFTKERKNDYEE